MSRSDQLTNAALVEQDRGTFLERSMRWWDVGYLLIFVVVAVVTVAVDLPVSDKVAALGGLAVIVTAYAVFGRRQLLSETDCRIRNAVAYLLVLYTMALLISYFSDIGNLLFFVAFSSTWMVLTVRWAIGGSVVLTLGIVFLNVAAAGWSPGAWAAGLAIGGGTAAAGVLLGLWITGVVEESERRNALIAELERTRTELGEHSTGPGRSPNGSGWRRRSTTPSPKGCSASWCTPARSSPTIPSRRAGSGESNRSRRTTSPRRAD